MTLLALAVAGALGTLARFGLSGFVHRFTISAFPSGTLAVNLLGCALLGLLLELARQTTWISPEARTTLGIGFLGAFTTFSTFGVETFRAVESGEWEIATLNVVTNLIGGLACVFFGVSLARWIVELRGAL
jgi:CrcB protein